MVQQCLAAHRQDLKLHFLDSGLLAPARGLSFDRVKADQRTFGALLERFVSAEVLKLMMASDPRPTPRHFEIGRA